MDDPFFLDSGLPVFPRQIEELIRALPQLAPHYLIELAREDARNSMIVSVEVNPAWSTACVEERAGYAQALQQSIKAHIGVNAVVRVYESGALARRVSSAS